MPGETDVVRHDAGHPAARRRCGPQGRSYLPTAPGAELSGARSVRVLQCDLDGPGVAFTARLDGTGPQVALNLLKFEAQFTGRRLAHRVVSARTTVPISQRTILGQSVDRPNHLKVRQGARVYPLQHGILRKESP